MKDARPLAVGRAATAMAPALVLVCSVLAGSPGCEDKSDRKAAAARADDAAPAREVDPAEVPYEALADLGSLAHVSLGAPCSTEEEALRRVGSEIESLRAALAETSEAAAVAAHLSKSAKKLSASPGAIGTDDVERARTLEELSALLSDLAEAFAHAGASIEKHQRPAAAAARTRIENAVENLLLTVERLEGHCSGD